MNIEKSTYQCLSQQLFEDKDGYALTPIRQEDIENIRLWRNAQMDVLRQQTVITPEEQQQYFSQVIAPDFSRPQPKQILFSFLFRNICIGYGGLTNIEWVSQRTELSFLVDPARAQDEVIYEKDFTHYLALLLRVAFQDLKLHRMFSETYIFRTSTIAIMEKVGFKSEGLRREHVYKQGQWHHCLMHGLLAKDYQPLYTTTGVLITSISNKIPLIQAVRKSGVFEKLHGCDSNPLCVGRYEVDTFWECPPTDVLTINSVIDYCLKHTIKAIIPTRNGELPFYAQHAATFAQKGIHVMVSGTEAISTCLDKLQFAQKLIAKQFPAIPTTVNIDDLKSSLFVVKERHGAGALQIGIALTREQAIAHSKQLQEPVFQPYVAGKEWSVDLYRTWEGEVKGAVARLRDYVVHGEAQVTTTCSNVHLEELCGSLMTFLSLYGHAVFQVIEDPQGRFHVVECNPRFGGASTASLAVGLDSFRWFLMESLGMDLKKVPFNRFEGEIRQVRHPADTITPMTEVPTNELWLFKNPKAYESIQRGLDQAENGKIKKLKKGDSLDQI